MMDHAISGPAVILTLNIHGPLMFDASETAGCQEFGSAGGWAPKWESTAQRRKSAMKTGVERKTTGIQQL
jgi:hypothetical protein